MTTVCCLAGVAVYNKISELIRVLIKFIAIWHCEFFFFFFLLSLAAVRLYHLS